MEPAFSSTPLATFRIEEDARETTHSLTIPARKAGGSDTDNKKTTKIRHLVFSGGGGVGWSYYGALRESNKEGFWNIDDIQTTHGVSCGALFLMFVGCLKQISWEDFDDFLIKRPWCDVFNINADRILNIYSNVGLFGRDTMQILVEPLLKALDLPLNVNLKQFYEFCGIESHIYITNFDTFELIDVSYKTHPEWTVIDTLHATCALPVLFRPAFIDGVVYVDGGFLCNYPIEECLRVVENPDEVFGMNKVHDPDTPTITGKEPANFLEYVSAIVSKTMNRIWNTHTKIRNTIEFIEPDSAFNSLLSILKSRENSAAKVDAGVVTWRKFKANLSLLVKIRADSHAAILDSNTGGELH